MDLNAENETIVEEVTLQDVDIEAERARQQADSRTHQVSSHNLIHSCPDISQMLVLFDAQSSL